MIRVLIFGTMGDIAQVAQQALERDGFEVAAVPFDQNVLRDESGYRRQLLRAIERVRPDVVLPVGNTVAAAHLASSLAAPSLGSPASSSAIPSGPASSSASSAGGQAAALRHASPLWPAFAVDAPERVDLLDSKLAASRLAARLGVPQPRIFASPDEVAAFPVIFKRDVSFAGSGVYKPSSREALERIVEHFAGKPALIEEYVEGSDWSVDAVRLDGYFRFSCYRSLASQGSHGQGPATLRELVDAPELGRYARLMLDAVDYHGVCGLDFRVTPDGRPFFLECNPRLTGGLATQLAAGFDISSLLVRSFL